MRVNISLPVHTFSFRFLYTCININIQSHTKIYPQLKFKHDMTMLCYPYQYCAFRNSCLCTGCSITRSCDGLGFFFFFFCFLQYSCNQWLSKLKKVRTLAMDTLKFILFFKYKKIFLKKKNTKRHLHQMSYKFSKPLGNYSATINGLL